MTESEEKTIIDEGLYSRQLYVLGHEAMKRMMTSSVLLVGLKGLGVEIAKNLILAGIKTLTIFDAECVHISDLSAQYYLNESDIGQRRDLASIDRLSELNRNVVVRVLESKEIAMETYSKFDVVVLTDALIAKQLEVNDYTHRKGIHFISANVFGLFGSVFCDFATTDKEGFLVHDVTGEEPVSGLVGSITLDKEAIVHCIEEARHNLEEGDLVTFKNIKGSVELNGCKPRKVRVIDPYSFAIGESSGITNYTDGGEFVQIKKTKVLSFRSLQEALDTPEFVISDFAKMDRLPTTHLGFIALSTFHTQYQRLPQPQSESDFQLVLEIAKNYITKSNAALIKVEDIDVPILRQLSFGAKGYLPSMTATIGGLTAQEVMKAISGKFHPIFQFFYFDSLESLPLNLTLSEAACQETQSRYDPQLAVFGKDFHESILNAKVFLVGAGAIGCELLKVWSMMGLGTGPQGKIYVTDMDTIEKSNLSRQLLFRTGDISKFKSQTAAEAIRRMNPDYMPDKIKAFDERVGLETESVFNDDFFNSLDLVVNALDNVDARKYMDRRCVFFKKPLLESGTLGTKCNTQVVIPHMTESYSSSQDPPEKSIPFCTLKNFPNAIEHTIQWSLDLFEGVYHNIPDSVNQYLSNPDFMDHLMKQNTSKIDILESIIKSLVSDRPITFEQCIVWARLRFDEYFNHNIRQLLFNFPPDAVTSTGTPFWSGPKKCPSPIVFDPLNEEHMRFIISSANLRAAVYGLKGKTERSFFKSVLSTVMVPEFTPKSGVKIHTSDAEANLSQSGGGGGGHSNGNDMELDLDIYLKQLPRTSTLAGYRLNALIFEKDDDLNHHIDFITASSNLRAINYNITPTDRYHAKLIAGKIIPAIATTTAFVAGLVSLELPKILNGSRKMEDYKNAFANLALPFFAFSEPIAASKFKYHEREWTLWDRFDILEDVTLRELIAFFKTEHALDISMVSHGRSVLFGFIRQKEELERRLSKKISELIATVTKVPLAPHTKSLVLEILVTDRDGEDVEVPYVCIHLSAQK